MVLNALTEQEIVRIQTSAAFRYGAQVNFQRFTSTEEAVEAAKQRAFSRFTTRVQGEQQTEIVVNAGEGRSTRELELIWWPDVFQHCRDYGKLTVRLFVSKTTFKR